MSITYHRDLVQGYLKASRDHRPPRMVPEQRGLFIEDLIGHRVSDNFDDGIPF